MQDNINIAFSDQELCNGCGTCIPLCPQNAIKIRIDHKKGVYTPKIDDKECNNCKICFKVCSSQKVNFKQLNQEIFGKEPENYLIGNYSNFYIGNSTIEDIRYNSASGGLITQLLIFALEEGIINGALVTRMKKDKPLEPEPFIAKTKEEIIDASKSKYCPVPANIALKEILKSKEGDKFAVVGLPCHINGIRRAEKYNKKLKERIVLHFGIFCSHTNSFNGTDYLLNVLGLNKANVKQIYYKGNGWPGKISIKLKDNTNFLIHNHDRSWKTIFNGLFFTPIACLLCNDLTAELSDISFGDPWLPEIMSKERKGKSILITRNKKGDELLKLALDKNVIKLFSTNSNELIKSQKTYLYLKKINIYKIIKIRNLLGKKSPEIPVHTEKKYHYSTFLAIFLLTNNYLGSKLGNLFNKIPFIIIEKYILIISFFLNVTVQRNSKYLEPEI